MNRPDFAAVLAAHLTCSCPDLLDKTHAAHLAAVLNAAVDAWLADEKTRDVRDYRAAYSRCVDLAEGWSETRGMVAWDVAADLLDAALTQREDTP
jgi:hypothetical protein